MKISTGIKYAIFAGIALLVNLGVQAGALKIYSGDYSIFFAMVCGTGAGLLVKYILDKLFIFKYRTENLKEDVKKFTLYSLMGIVTTAIFWGFELLFDKLIHTEWAKFAGGAVGLTIGYILKYFLDRKFVFTAKPSGEDDR